MSFSLDALLPLAGRLDDGPGFDTPRERFRRFLIEHVTDLDTARALIEDCQRSVGAQRHRALQDLVVLLGRFLKFEIAFGSYEPSPGDAPTGGRWRSPGLLDVMLEIRTDQTSAATVDDLAHAVEAQRAQTAGTRPDREASLGLCVVARHYGGRARLTQAATAPFPNVSVVPVRSLLSLAGQVASDRLSHEEVVRLLRSGLALDFFIDLLDRSGAAARPNEQAPEPQMERRAIASDHREPAFWVATVSADETSTADQLLASVIGRRHLLAVAHAGRFRDEGSPGDWVCFFLPDKGITGHAQLSSAIEDSSNVVREAARFSHVYRLTDVTLYEEPVVRALRSERPFAIPPHDTALAGAFLAPIGRHDFLDLTAHREGAGGSDRLRTPA
jgi:hypothetical protein